VPRQLATLVAFLHTLEATAQDDVLDLVDRLLTDLFTEAVSTGHKAGCFCTTPRKGTFQVLSSEFLLD
jgi:hypothetical protein